MTAERRRVRVLVIEDEPLIAMAVEDALEALDCEVVGPFSQLSEAMAAAERGGFDCAILDVNIRGGLIYPVAALLIDRGVPILLSTGYSNGSLPDSLAREARIAKPYSSAQLDDALRHLCGRVS